MSSTKKKAAPKGGARDPRIDAYIAEAEPFARPILEEIRDLVHEVCPEVEESVKWGMPFFNWKGMLCHFASFQTHCSLGFWKWELLGVPGGLGAEGMGSFGKVTKRSDLPSKKALTTLIRAAMKLNEEGKIAPSRAKRVEKGEAEVPEALAAALAKKGNAAAKRQWEEFSPGKRREYAEWIAEAKRDETRDKRIAEALIWIAEGKSRNWKYQ